MKTLAQLEVPRWPFKIANLVIFPIAILAFGSYRVWVTAATPFEEFSGILGVVTVALLWPVLFVAGVFASRALTDVCERKPGI